MSSEQVAYPALEEIERRLRSGAIHALTSDVFDTIVWRTVPEPADAFVALGQALRDRGALDPSLNPRSFARLRQTGEASAREALRIATDSTEVNLGEIWERIPAWCHKPLDRTAAIELEIDLEREILTPDLDVIQLLRTASQAGIPIYAVSDTYFSPAQVRELLEQPFLDEIHLQGVFTSSDRRTGKSGELFDHVLAEIECAPELVAHLGDNDTADVTPAQKRGISVAHVPRRSDRLEHLLRRESSYRRVRALAPASSEDAARADLAELDGSLVQLRAKLALHREAESTPSALRPMWHYGAEVLGPPLAGFAEWVIEEAGALGTRKLHCLMREGDFLGELIAQAAAAADSDVEVSRLYLNRQLATLASIGDASRAEVERLLVRRDAPTVRELLTMLGLDTADVTTLTGYLDSRLDNRTRCEQALDALEDDAVRIQIQAHTRTLRERVARLVRREHDDGDDSFLLVDLGWGASIQRRLAQALHQVDFDLRVDGLYLLTHSGAVDTITLGGRVGGFLASVGHPAQIADAVKRSPEVLEQVCMPDHGTQLDLTEELEPVLDVSCLPEAQRVEAAAVRDGIRAFQRTYLRYRSALPEKIPPLASAAEQLAPIVARACIDPTLAEAARFGAWHHDAGQGTDEVERLAGEQMVEQLRSMDPEQIRALHVQDVYWPSAAARLVDPFLGDLLAAQAAGLIHSKPEAREAETGQMVIEASAGSGISMRGTALVPRRNHRGLSSARTSILGDRIERLQIHLGTRPAMLRVDRLVLRLFVDDEADPISFRLEQTGHLDRLDLLNVIRISDRVFASTHEYGVLGLAISDLVGTRRVHRVDVELSFMVLGWDPPLFPGLPERELQAVLSSASWRLTQPLRSLKRLLRRN